MKARYQLRVLGRVLYGRVWGVICTDLASGLQICLCFVRILYSASLSLKNGRACRGFPARPEQAPGQSFVRIGIWAPPAAGGFCTDLTQAFPDFEACFVRICIRVLPILSGVLKEYEGSMLCSAWFREARTCLFGAAQLFYSHGTAA